MKKFISMVMAAAMVVSMVPATAFAGDIEATAKIQDKLELTEAEAENANGAITGPELRIKVTDATYTSDNTTGDKFDFTVKLDGAEFKKDAKETAANLVKLVSIDAATGNALSDLNLDNTTTGTAMAGGAYIGAADVVNAGDVKVTVLDKNIDKDEFKFTIEGKLMEDDIVAINLTSVLEDTDEGEKATVTLKSDLVDVSDLVYAEVLGEGIVASIDDTDDVAEEEIVELTEAIEVEPAAGDNFKAVMKSGEKIKLKLNSGFEFYYKGTDKATIGGIDIVEECYDENEIVIVVADSYAGILDMADLEIVGLYVEATSAKVGDVATISVKFGDCDAVKVDVATVVAEGVSISVDEDEDVPEMWSGVPANSTAFLTDDDDNTSLAFTLKESVVGAHDTKDVIELVLPEGVYVVGATGVDVKKEAGEISDSTWETMFATAYAKADHVGFEFAKRAIANSTTEAWEIDVTLELVADPGFVGDVVVEMLVDGESVGEVTIATFKTPVIVEAQANDLKIDYRNTKVGSDIVVKEAEAGLWAKDLTFGFDIDDKGVMQFEDDVEYTVNEDESDMEIKGQDKYVEFKVKEVSDEEAAVVTISNLSLFMERNIPAGAYDLTMNGGQSKSAASNVFVAFNAQTLFAAETAKCTCDDTAFGEHDCDKHLYVDDVCDYSDVVKEGFINVVTAGREQDDASFTTKVVVPVGEAYMVAGEQTIALDVPAYVSAAGYTMLPVRAVATALGISNNNVLWDQATKTVTILYGQRIITMQVGASVINVNGSAIPASASVEIVNGRTFLPMRDLATALGVTNITWDQATKTATLNG